MQEADLLWAVGTNTACEHSELLSIISVNTEMKLLFETFFLNSALLPTRIFMVLRTPHLQGHIKHERACEAKNMCLQYVPFLKIPLLNNNFSLS